MVASAVGGAACAGRTAPGASAARDVDPRWDAAARELTADEQVRHALARLTFGARPDDAAAVRALGVDRWIERQLAPETIDDRAMDAFLARFRTLAEDGAALRRAYPPPAQLLVRQALAQRRAARATSRIGLDARPDDTVPNGTSPVAATAAPNAMADRARPVPADTLATRARRPALALTAADSARLGEARRRSQRPLVELRTARVARAVASERQLQEVMTDLWANHFSVFAGKGQLRYELPSYDATLRIHALGRFRDLLGAVARHPAMLEYLDNARSAATGSRGPLGRSRGLNENYARELLELHTLGVDGGYTEADVVAVARALTGWTVAPAVAGGGFVFRRALHDAGEKVVLGHRLPAGRGVEDGEQVLDLVARHPSTARHVARTLAVRFVSDTPPPALVARAAETFRATDGDLRATLRTILHAPEFFSRAAYRAKVKLPLELVASTARALGAAPDPTPRTALLVARLGQPLYGRQAPDGWPETAAPWLTAGAILQRIEFGAAVAAGRVAGLGLDASPLAGALRTAAPDRRLDAVVDALLGGAASPDTRAMLHAGANPLLARRDTLAHPAPPATRDPLARLVGLALGAPEFQRR